MSAPGLQYSAVRHWLLLANPGYTLYWTARQHRLSRAAAVARTTQLHFAELIRNTRNVCTTS